MAESGGHSLTAKGYVGLHADTSALPAELAHAHAMFKESFKNIAEIAAGIMAAAGIRSFVDSMKEVVGGFISVNAKFEVFQITLAQVFRSQSAAMNMVDNLHVLAGKLALPMQPLVDATLSLKKFGFETKAIIPMLTTIADAAAMFPASMQEGMGKVVSAFSRIQASGAMTSRNMLMLFRAGIPAADILANKLGVTKAKVDAMLKAGKLTAPIAIPALLAGMKEKFGGLAEKIADTWGGLMSRLHHAWEYFLKQIGSPIFDVAKSGLKAVVDWFHSDSAHEWIAKLRGGIEYVIGLVRSALHSAWLPVVVRIAKAALTAISFVGSIEMAIMVCGRLSGILHAALSPMGLLVIGVTILADMLTQALDGPHGKELRATLSDILAIGREIGLHLMKAFGDFFKWLETTWNANFGGMQGASDSLFGTIGNWFKFLLTQVAIFTADFGLAWEMVKEGAKLAWLYIQDAFIAFKEIAGAKLSLVWLTFQSAAEAAFEVIKPYAYGFLSMMAEIGTQIGANLKVALADAFIFAKHYAQASLMAWKAGEAQEHLNPKLAAKRLDKFSNNPQKRAEAKKAEEELEKLKKSVREKEFENQMRALSKDEIRPLPGFGAGKVGRAWESGKAVAPQQTDADKERIAKREKEMKRLSDLEASPSTTDAEKEFIRERMKGIMAAMNEEREKQKAAQAAKDKSDAFWAELRKKQQVLARPEDEGKDKKADAGAKKGKGGAKEFGIVDVAQFAKDLQMAIQKSDEEKMAEGIENMEKQLKDAKAAGGKALNVAIVAMPDMVARCV